MVCLQCLEPRPDVIHSADLYSPCHHPGDPHCLGPNCTCLSACLCVCVWVHARLSLNYECMCTYVHMSIPRCSCTSVWSVCVFVSEEHRGTTQEEVPRAHTLKTWPKAEQSSVCRVLHAEQHPCLKSPGSHRHMAKGACWSKHLTLAEPGSVRVMF